jgi:hypothetical protein
VRSYTEELQHIFEKVDALGKKRAAVTATEKLAEQLLKDFKAPAAKQKQYTHRLGHGLQNYYIRHYQPSAKHVVEE